MLSIKGQEYTKALKHLANLYSWALLDTILMLFPINYHDYHKFPKYLDTWEIAVITLKFEQGGFTTE